MAVICMDSDDLIDVLKTANPARYVGMAYLVVGFALLLLVIGVAYVVFLDGPTLGLVGLFREIVDWLKRRITGAVPGW